MRTKNNKCDEAAKPQPDLDVAAIIGKAIRVLRKPAGPLRREGILKVLYQHTPDKRQWVRIINGFQSANWRVVTDNCGQYHEIGVGSDFRVSCVERIRGNPRKLQRFCESLIRHEAAHGMFSESDISKMALECSDLRIPWGLLNLFEDARIEHLERDRSRDPLTGKLWRFHWWCFTPHPKETARPSQYFWALINKEASSWSRYSAGAPRWLGKPGVDARIRDHYYHRAIRAAQTGDLLPLCRGWMDEFRPPPRILPAAGNSTPQSLTTETR